MLHERKVLKYKGQVVFEKVSIPYFQRMPKRYEKNEACFMFVEQGAFSVRTPSEFISLKEGNGLLSKCFDYFFETSQKQRENSDHIELIGIIIHPTIVEELYDFNSQLSTHKLNYNTKNFPVDKLLLNYKESLHILLDNPDLADEAMIQNKLKEFILLLRKTENTASITDFLSALFKTNPTSFTNTVNNNIYSSLSIEEFAHLCHMSVSSFKRKFQEAYGESPAKYLLHVKLEKAAQLLLYKTERISDIAYDCGFESLATFNRNFKNKYGKSPSAFRLNHIDSFLN